MKYEIVQTSGYLIAGKEYDPISLSEQLEKMVNKRIASGWCPCGGVSVVVLSFLNGEKIFYSQAMTIRVS